MATPYLTMGLANMSSQKSSSLGVLVTVIDVFIKISGMTSAQKYQMKTVAVSRVLIIETYRGEKVIRISAIAKKVSSCNTSFKNIKCIVM